MNQQLCNPDRTLYLYSIMDADMILQIVEKRRKELNLSQAQLGERAFGKSDASAVQNLKRGSSPTADRLQGLADALDLEFYFGPRRAGSGVNELWLDDPTQPHVTDEGYAAIPRLDLDLSAGGGLVPPEGARDAAEYMAFARPWLAREGISATQAALVRVRGDSMTPTIPDGALVLVDRGDTTVRREGIFAFSRSGDAFVKRLLPIATSRRDDLVSLVIVSDNPLVPTEVVQGHELDELHIAGRVRCVLWTVA